MIDWKGSQQQEILEIAHHTCSNQLKKSLQDQRTKDVTKLPDLSPNLHHVPPLNEDVNEDKKKRVLGCLVQTEKN